MTMFPGRAAFGFLPHRTGIANSASLQPLTGTFRLAEDAVAGDAAGTVSGKTSGSALSLVDDAGGRVALSGAQIVRGATALDYETAASHSFTVRETLAGATNSPRDTVMTITVTNVFEAANLSALALSATTFTAGTPSSGTITGATAGSTITASGLPSGLTINGAARTWAWDGTGTASTGSLTLTETLTDSANSPRDTVIGYTIEAAGGGTTLNASLPVPTASLAVAPGTFPPQFTLDWFGGDLLEGDEAEAQRCANYDFSGTIYTHGPVTADAAAAAAEELDFGFSTVTSGVFFYRFRTIRGTEHSNWSTTVSHGDTVAPTITGGTTSSAERAPMAVTVTADEPSYFALGGIDMDLLEKVGSEPATSITIRLLGNADLDYETKAQYLFTVTPTDLSGNEGSAAAFTHNVNDVDEQPDSFAFTDTTGAALSTVYTSTITVAGLAAGITVSGTFSGDGDYRKNGGAWVTTPSFTATNGDTFESRITSASAGATSKANTFSIGEPAVSDTHSVSTASAFAPSSLWTAAQYGYALDPTDTTHVWQDSARTTAGAVAAPVGAIDDVGSGSARNFTQTTSGKRPTLVDIGGGGLALQFDGTDDYLQLAAAGLYNAGGCTIIFAAKVLTVASTNPMLVELSLTDVNPRYTPGMRLNNDNGWQNFARNDAGTILSATASPSGGYTSAWHLFRIVDSGGTVTMTRDRVLGNSRALSRSGTLSMTTTRLCAWTTAGVDSGFANVQIGRFIAIGRTDLTSTELANAEAWCAAPYGIVLP